MKKWNPRPYSGLNYSRSNLYGKISRCIGSGKCLGSMKKGRRNLTNQIFDLK